ncbi:MAG: Wzz/FepE/Etk N-terminal domain-containing protein [Bacteroidota bacterium]
MENEKFQNDRSLLLLFIWKKRKFIILVTLAVAIITTVVTFFMTPLFLSSAIVFPTATSTVSFSEQRNAKASSMDFGEEEQAEQLVQILSSSRIRDILVKRYDLMKHYEIDANDANKNYKLGLAYSSHIQFTRTKYGSIQIDVLDRDRELAAEIANKIVDLIDTVKNQMVKERTVPAYEINKRKKELIETSMNQLSHKLDSLSAIGVVTSEARANLFQALIDAKNPADKEFVRKQIDVNIKHGAEFDGLYILRNEKTVKLAFMEEAYEQAESDANTNFNHKFVVEKAVVADKKEKPKKAIIILVTSLMTAILLIFGLLIQEKIKELRNMA